MPTTKHNHCCCMARHRSLSKGSPADVTLMPCNLDPSLPASSTGVICDTIQGLPLPTTWLTLPHVQAALRRCLSEA